MAEAVWSGPLVVGGATGGGRLGRNVCLGDCNIGDMISKSRHYVCIVPLLWSCIFCRSLDVFLSSLVVVRLPQMCQQCLFIYLIPVYVGILVMWDQRTSYSRVGSESLCSL